MTSSILRILEHILSPHRLTLTDSRLQKWLISTDELFFQWKVSSSRYLPFVISHAPMAPLYFQCSCRPGESVSDNAFNSSAEDIPAHSLNKIIRFIKKGFDMNLLNRIGMARMETSPSVEN